MSDNAPTIYTPNRLLGTKVYLIGNMDRVADGGETWRRELTPWLQNKGIFVFDPCCKPILHSRNEAAGRNHINELKAAGDYGKIRELYGEEVRGLDLRMVDESAFIICYLDIEGHPCGTYEEWFTANKAKKPVLTVVKGGKINTPNWLLLAMPHQFFFDDFDQLKEYITHIDSFNGEIETFKRWRFFDWHKLVGETLKVYDFENGKPKDENA